MGVTDGYLKVRAVCDGGYFVVETNTALVEEDVSLVFMTETLDADGNTAVDRQFGFRTSALYGASHSPIATAKLFRNVCTHLFTVTIGIYLGIFLSSRR